VYDYIFLVGSGLHVRLYSQQKNTKLGAEKQTANLRTCQHVIHRRAGPILGFCVCAFPCQEEAIWLAGRRFYTHEVRQLKQHWPPVEMGPQEMAPSLA